MSTFRIRDLTWRAKASYAAHAFKAVAKQHHTEMLPLLRTLIKRDGLVFDIGGHMGQFAKLFAGIAADGHVYTFEPSGYAGSILRLGLKARAKANVTIVAQGLGDQPGTTTLTTPLKARGTFRYGLAHMGDHDRDGAAHSETCAITTIDTFMQSEGLARLDFLKMDVEGWERRVLSGGADTIRRYRPPMMVELVDRQLGRAGDSLVATWADLISWGYRPMGWTGGDALSAIEEPRDGDIFWLPE